MSLESTVFQKYYGQYNTLYSMLQIERTSGVDKTIFSKDSVSDALNALQLSKFVEFEETNSLSEFLLSSISSVC